MELDDAIKKRRSVRVYSERIPPVELIKKCIEAACQAPSAHNSQPWKFFIVTNKEKIEKLSRIQKYSTFLKNAPVVITVASQESAHFLEDCSCAIMLLMLKATELGLGTCWNAVYHPDTIEREEYVKEVLGVSDYRIVANIGIGYPAEEPEEKRVKDFEEAAEVVE